MPADEETRSPRHVGHDRRSENSTRHGQAAREGTMDGSLRRHRARLAPPIAAGLALATSRGGANLAERHERHRCSGGRYRAH